MTVNEQLAELVRRAEAGAERMSIKNPNRALLRDMSLALVGMAQRIAELQTQIEEKPRIVCP